MNCDLDYKNLGEIAELQRGKTQKKYNIGIVPIVSGGLKPQGYTDIYNRDNDIITVSGSGINAGFVQYWDKPIYAADCFTIKSEELSNKFIYYYLKSLQDYIDSLKQGAGIPHVYPKQLSELKIPVPSEAVQGSVVSVLDKLSNYTHDVKEGLPAEIEARERQLEYYLENLIV